jgi:HD-GYP domain-containing protein (c-di-GMP phosphodiesterase class II)
MVVGEFSRLVYPDALEHCCASFPFMGKIIDGLVRFGGHTLSHSLQTGDCSFHVACRLKMSLPERNLLSSAGTLHDCGKILLPPEIINKNGQLNNQEREIIETHVRLGFEWVSKYSLPIAKVLALHHEFQPNNYPRKNKGSLFDGDRREKSKKILRFGKYCL